MDNPLFTRRISAGTRVYYFDVHTDKKGQPFLEISEICTDKAPEKKKRQRMFIHVENLDKFAMVFCESAHFIKEMKNGKTD